MVFLQDLRNAARFRDSVAPAPYSYRLRYVFVKVNLSSQRQLSVSLKKKKTSISPPALKHEWALGCFLAYLCV